MIIMKFGGSSIKDAQAMLRVADIVEQHLPQQPLVVLSALGGVTDQLLRLHQVALEQKDLQLSSEFNNLKDRHLQMLKTLIAENRILDETMHF